MIILDTNVVSELMLPNPNPIVFDWFYNQDPSSLYTTSVTEAELRRDAAILPAGRRKNKHIEAIESTLRERFGCRILSFDSAAAHAYAAIGAARRAAGLSVAVADCMIAAIARSHGASIATRDAHDFKASGVPLINPWSHP